MDNERLIYSDYLDNRFTAISSGCEDYMTQLSELSEQLAKLYPDNISSLMMGDAANSIATYLNNTYTQLMYDISAIISAEQINYMLYRNDYMNLDTQLHFGFSQPQFATIHGIISSRNSTLWEINQSVVNAIQAVSNIDGASLIPFVGYNSEYLDTTLSTVDTLNENINTLETSHYSNDFTEISELIASVKTALQSLLQITRTSASDFTYVSSEMEALEGSTILAAQIFDVLKQNEDEISQAATASNERYVEIRQENAEIVNTFVNVFAFSAATILTVATAGAASPLLVAVIAGGTTCVTCVTQEVTAQYIETGDWVPYDIGRVAGKGALGFATGFAFGYLGATVSPIAVSGFSQVPGFSFFLNSSSLGLRVIGNVAVGAMTEVSCGAVNRYVTTLIDNLVFEGSWDPSAALDEATNLSAVAQDVVSGSISGAVDGFNSKDPNIKQPARVSGEDWNNYFAEKYGAENVEWVSDTFADYDGNMTGADWNNYFAEKYGVENVEWVSDSFAGFDGNMTGADWNNYFAETYGVENVIWRADAYTELEDFLATAVPSVHDYQSYMDAVGQIGSYNVSLERKVEAVQYLYSNSSYKSDIICPTDVRYVQDINASGVTYRFEELEFFGINPKKPYGSINPSDAFLPDYVTKIGYCGSNASGACVSTVDPDYCLIYSNKEISVPYVENLEATHMFYVNSANSSYFKKIDCIINGDLFGMNDILATEYVKPLSKKEFEYICENYANYLADVATKKGIPTDLGITYGFYGEAAPWGTMPGGAPQFNLPLSPNNLTRINALTEVKLYE